MKRVKVTRFMAFLSSVTVLMACVCIGGILPAAGATLTNVTATTLTAVPTATSLLSGKTPMANSASDHSKNVAYGGTNVANVTDGNYPGINTFVTPVRDADGNLVNVNESHPEYGIKNNVNDSIVQFSCWTNDYIDLTFALGSENKITSFVVGSSAEPSALLKTDVQDWTDEQIIDAYKTKMQTTIRLFKGEFYVADTAAALFDATAIAASWDYTGETTPLAAEYTLEQPAKGQYVGFRLYIGSGWASLFRIGELAVFGKSTTHKVTDISAGVNEDKLIAAEDNLLGKAISNKNNATWQATLPETTYDGKVVSVHGDAAAIHTMVAAGSDTFWVTYDLGAEYAVESFLFSGGGSWIGCRGIMVYVGNKTHEQLMADPDAEPVYSSPVTGANDGKADRIPGTKRIDFVEPVVGRYMVIRLAGEPNGANYQYWISELAATGSPLKEIHKIVCVGDSITFGAYAPTVGSFSYQQFENNYPVQLEKMLDAAQDDVDYMVVNAGIGGSAVVGASEGYPSSYGTAPVHWLTDQEPFGYVQEADTVLIMLGTNDASNENGCWAARTADYKTYYKKIIAAFREKNADVNVYIVTSPYANANNHRENLANGVVPQQAQLAGELGLPLIDVYAATRQFVADNNPGVTDETQWDMHCFVDAVDLQQGPYLHPHEEGLAVIAKTCFDALMAGDTSDQYVLSTVGAQIRGDVGKTAALRFGSVLPSTGIEYEANSYVGKLTEQSQIVVGGQVCRVVGLGTIVGKGDVTVDDMVLGTNTKNIKDVRAINLYDVKADEVVFTAVVINIPADHFDTTLSARAYVQYITPAGEALCAYGDVVTRTVNDLL